MHSPIRRHIKKMKTRALSTLGLRPVSEEGLSSSDIRRRRGIILFCHQTKKRDYPLLTSDEEEGLSSSVIRRRRGIILFCHQTKKRDYPLLTSDEEEGLSSSDTRRRQVSKALVFYISLCRRIGEYISLELFCFVSLTSSCLLIPNLICIYRTRYIPHSLSHAHIRTHTISISASRPPSISLSQSFLCPPPPPPPPLPPPPPIRSPPPLTPNNHQ